MKLLESKVGHEVECRFCGAHYLVERGDPVADLGFDPEALLRDAAPGSDSLRFWDGYTTMRNYFREFKCSWRCPVCDRKDGRLLSDLPLDWQPEALARAGFAGLDSPLDHPAVREIDRRNYERYGANLKSWARMSCLDRRKHMTSYDFFGDLDGARAHAKRHGLPEPKYP